MEENYILIFARAFNIYIFSDRYDSDKIQKILRAFLIIYDLFLLIIIQLKIVLF